MFFILGIYNFFEIYCAMLLKMFMILEMGIKVSNGTKPLNPNPGAIATIACTLISDFLTLNLNKNSRSFGTTSVQHESLQKICVLVLGC